VEYPLIFGILLVATGGSSVACGLYAMQNNTATPVKRVFVALGVSLLFWCLGLAVTVAAGSEDICALGRRLAPFGWGTILSFMLHFILLLTRNRLLKKWWVYPLLYIPAAVTVFAYTFLPLIGLNPDHLIRTALGWMNIAKTDAWDWFYYITCVVYVVIANIVLFLWAKNSPSKNIKKQVRLLVSSLSVACVLGALSDVLPVFLQIRVPQFSPVFVLFPMAAISYSVKRHGFMQPEAEDRNELILNAAAYTNVYRYIGLIFAAGSVLNLVVQFLIFKETTLPSVLFSGALIAISVFLFWINRVKLDDSTKEMLLAAAIAFIIPILTLWFVFNGGNMIWPFIFLLIIICLLFNRRTILITVIASSALTQLLVWAAVPSVSAQVGTADYIVRIVMIGLAAVLSFYVNRVYVQRLKENANQISIQTLVSETSHDFVSANEQNFGDKVHAMLKRCGSFIGSDSACIALFDSDTSHIRYSAEWLAEGAAPSFAGLEGLTSDMLPLLLERFEARGAVKLSDTALMPPGDKLKAALAGRNIRALLALPIKKEETVIGLLAFASARPLTDWNAGLFTSLEVITNIVVDAVIKVNAEKEINFMAYHDQLTRLPNRFLFVDRLAQAIRRAERTGKILAVAFLDLDSFKSVNDTLGHELGDRFLCKAARILSGSIRGYDTLARFGGDEFVFLINDIDCEQDIIRIMDKIMEAIRQPVLLNGQEFFISASTGVALYPQDGMDAETLIKNADIAMYNAKTWGKNQYVLCARDKG
jgi:diguanylate cyclase (GGDEF)-like protein